jgi:rod shape-determining protein MreC
MRRSYSKNIIITIALALGLVLIGRLGFIRPVSVAIDYATAPIRAGFRFIGSRLSGVGTNISSIRSLDSENARLKQQVSQLKEHLSEEAEVRQENDILRRQLQVGGASNNQLLAADVIGYQPDNFRQFLTIAKGTNDGLRPGMAVVSDGVLVGTLSDVAKTTAKVFLVTDPNFKANGIDQESRANGTVHGQLGSGLIMDKIAQGDSLKPGDTIVTSGLGGEIPKGLIIGQIESVDQRDNQVFQTAQISSPLRVNKLELVFIRVNP